MGLFEIKVKESFLKRILSYRFWDKNGPKWDQNELSKFDEKLTEGMLE